jgi:hypothetical protein
MARIATRTVTANNETQFHKDNEKTVVFDYRTGMTTVHRTLHRRWSLRAEGWDDTTTIYVGDIVVAELPTDISVDRTLVRFMKAVSPTTLATLTFDGGLTLSREQHELADALARAFRSLN